MLLFYIRHGQPIYDPDSLTPLGRRQAEAVGRRLAQSGVDRVFASTSPRAIQTATPCAEILGKPITQLDFANEGHAWQEFTSPADTKEGKAWGFQHPQVLKLFNSPEIRALGFEWYKHPFFEGTRYGEGITRIRQETDAFLESLGYRHDGDNFCYIPVKPTKERIALFAHQGFGLVFLSCVLDMPYPLFAVHADMQHSGLCAIDFSETDGVVIPKLLQLSNDAHLYAEHLPTRYNDSIQI